jgi:hypothetical protein
MVMGIFGAAIQSMEFNQNERQNPYNNEIVVDEHENGPSVVGEAPTSANTEIQSNAIEPIDTNNYMISMTGEGELMPIPEEKQVFADIPDMEGDFMNPTNGDNSAMRDSHGTRIAPGTWIDAGGPYGTPDDPLYEGWTQTFSPTMHVDDPNNYDWRWNIGDGWTDWSASPDYTTTFTDNPKGEAQVQAWDGTETIVPEFGKPLDETDNIYMYAGNYEEVVFGYRFIPLVDCKIVSLGRLHSTLDDIYEFDAVYLWDESNPSTPLASVPASQAYGWQWGSITPVDV